MARIAGVDLPRDKRVEIALTYIYGIGRPTANRILTTADVNPDTRVRDLTEDEVSRLREVIDQEYRVEGDLRKEVALNIKRLMDIGCYRGLRHRRGLPVRGQRTRTNARTRRGTKRASSPAEEEAAPAKKLSRRLARERERDNDGKAAGSQEHAQEEGAEEHPDAASPTSVHVQQHDRDDHRPRRQHNLLVVRRASASRARARARRTRRGAAENAAAQGHGARHAAVEVYVKGPGSGREAAIRALQAAGSTSASSGT